MALTANTSESGHMNWGWNLDEFNVTFLISNYHSKDHFDHPHLFEEYPEYKEYAKVPTRHWQVNSGWIRACCFYDAAKKALGARIPNGEEFVELFLRIRRRSDDKVIENIHYLQPVQLYFPEGSYCPEHVNTVLKENSYEYIG